MNNQLLSAPLARTRGIKRNMRVIQSTPVLNFMPIPSAVLARRSNQQTNKHTNFSVYNISRILILRTQLVLISPFQIKSRNIRKSYFIYNKDRVFCLGVYIVVFHSLALSQHIVWFYQFPTYKIFKAKNGFKQCWQYVCLN